MSLLTNVMDFLDSAMRIGMGKTNGHLIATQAKQVAKQVAGKPYKWGGDDLSGFDCSGYVQFVLKQAFPNQKALQEKDRSAAQLVMELCDEVSKGGAGDLVFFPKMELANCAYEHVGIMVNETHFLGAQSSTGVAQVTLTNSYWKKRIRKFYRLRSTPAGPNPKQSTSRPAARKN